MDTIAKKNSYKAVSVKSRKQSQAIGVITDCNCSTTDNNCSIREKIIENGKIPPCYMELQRNSR